MMTAMYWYAQTSLRRTRQILADVVVVAWVLVWVLVARAVHASVSALAGPAVPMRSAGDALSARMLDVADRVGGVPVVGDQLRAPFAGTATVGTDLGTAATRLESSVDRAALWLSLLTCATPILLVLGLYAVARWRGVRAMNASARYRDDPNAHALLALRALATAPSRDLVAIGPDPLQAWQRGDPDVVRALSALELRRSGLKPSPG
jgi:hypothetical protein